MNCSAPAYPGGSDFAVTVLSRCDTAALEQFFHSLGLQLRTEDMGRVYPGQRPSRLCIGCFSVGAPSGRRGSSYCVPCPCVTSAQGRLSAQYHRWQYLRPSRDRNRRRKSTAEIGKRRLLFCAADMGFGHHLVRPFPALTQIETDTQPIRGLSGIRIRTEAWITQGSQTLHRTEGEALFADYVSGDCIMQLARYAQGRSVQLHLNFIRAMGFTILPPPYSRSFCGANSYGRMFLWNSF